MSNLEILEMIETVTDLAVPYDPAPRRDGDLTQLYADPQRAKDVLNFTAQYSDLKNIISSAWAFHKKTWQL